MPPIIVNDPSFRHDQSVEITEEMRVAYFHANGVPLSDKLKIVPQRDTQGRIMQDLITVSTEIKEPQLSRMVKRAKRWLNSSKPAIVKAKPPRHILYCLSALRQVEAQGS